MTSWTTRSRSKTTVIHGIKFLSDYLKIVEWENNLFDNNFKKSKDDSCVQKRSNSELRNSVGFIYMREARLCAYPCGPTLGHPRWQQPSRPSPAGTSEEDQYHGEGETSLRIGGARVRASAEGRGLLARAVEGWATKILTPHATARY